MMSGFKLWHRRLRDRRTSGRLLDAILKSHHRRKIRTAHLSIEALRTKGVTFTVPIAGTIRHIGVKGDYLVAEFHWPTNSISTETKRIHYFVRSADGPSPNPNQGFARLKVKTLDGEQRVHLFNEDQRWLSAAEAMQANESGRLQAA